MALPDRIYTEASPLSLSGESLLSQTRRIRLPYLTALPSQPDMISAATQHLHRTEFGFSQAIFLTNDFASVPGDSEKIFLANIPENEILRRPLTQACTAMSRYPPLRVTPSRRLTI